jgi:hypothetical protein
MCVVLSCNINTSVDVLTYHALVVTQMTSRDSERSVSDSNEDDASRL